jgi:hypothetical protein
VKTFPEKLLFFPKAQADFFFEVLVTREGRHNLTTTPNFLLRQKEESAS